MFNRDILLIDEENSGLDSQRHEIIQLAAVLLDKKTLKEKKHFNSYIRPKRWYNHDPLSSEVHHITWDQLKSAPGLKTVLQKFNRSFGNKAVLTYYGGINDISFLHQAYKRSRMTYPFDYHTFNLWGLFYAYGAKKRLLKSKKHFGGFTLDSLAAHFKIESPPRHDALVDCRVEAEILRRVIKDFKV